MTEQFLKQYVNIWQMDRAYNYLAQQIPPGNNLKEIHKNIEKFNNISIIDLPKTIKQLTVINTLQVINNRQVLKLVRIINEKQSMGY